MAAFHPSFDALPAEIAIFPLSGALLLPGGKLPLNIFEPRYLAMVQEALANGRMLGMIQPDALAESVENGPALFRVGCLGRLSSFAETDDGRLLITLTGVIRFRIAAEIAMRHGYRRVRADYAQFAPDLAVPAPAPAPGLGERRDHILAALRSYFAARGLDANWEAISQMSDPALVITLCMACPFDPAEKQALLEAPTDAERAAALLTLLQMAAHEDREAEVTRHVS